VSGRHASGARPGDGLVRAGAVLFALGVLAVLVVVGGFFLQRDVPSAFAVLTVLAPAGLALALLGLLRGARSSSPGR
jgi:hypothetical protein